MNKQTILVVDDTPENIDVLKGILTESYEIKAAINGLMALNIAQKWKPDLILLDIMMPEMDGYEVCKKLKSNVETQKIPVIFVTANDQVIDETHGFEVGAVDYITKPVSPPVVLARIKTQLTLYDQNRSLEILLKEKTSAKERIDKELKIARDIQQSILPSNFHDYKKFDVYAKLIAARELGGDLYDFFMIDDDKLCFAIGDVSGKGVSSALFMAITKTLLREKIEINLSLAAAVSEMNKAICKLGDTAMFVTFFICILNLKTGKVEYCNAGHNPPVLGKGGRDFGYMDTDNPSPPLGVSYDTEYKNQSLNINSGDILVLYTDGITEAMSKDYEQFSDEKFLKVLSDNKGKSLSDITENLLEAIRKHSEGAEQSDDITLLAIKYNG